MMRGVEDAWNAALDVYIDPDPGDACDRSTSISSASPSSAFGIYPATWRNGLPSDVSSRRDSPKPSSGAPSHPLPDRLNPKPWRP